MIFNWFWWQMISNSKTWQGFKKQGYLTKYEPEWFVSGFENDFEIESKYHCFIVALF